MTRAKPKPSIQTREPASKPRAEKPAPAEATPTKPTSVKAVVKPAPPVKAMSTVQTAPVKKARTAQPAPAKALPAAKSAPSKAAPVAKAASKALSVAKAVRVAATTKATSPLKPAPAKSASTKAVAGKTSMRLDTPAKLRPIEQAVGVSSDAVARRTGKSWAEWFALLDAAGAAELDHKGIVAVLAQRHGVGPWWQQMVTVAYEQARGKNGNTTTEDGFQVDVSKVLELPLAKLFRFWAEPSERNKWLADDRFSIHKATASKSIRARWGRGVSRIDVDFCEKGPSKSQVTVQHNRIETSDAAEQMKAYWAKKIRALEALTRP